jgi:tetratricopeptide (TPR) repeat protein
VFGRSLRDPSLQLVTIVGEPGVGKSRLVSEFFRYIDEERDELIYWRQGRCLPYGNGVTFWALGEIVKAHADILETDDQGEALSKLEQAVAALHLDVPDREWVASRLAPLVGISHGGANVEQSESFAAWQRFLEGVAAGGPLVVVIEDLHWADDAMLDFIEQLVEWSNDLPITLLCNARPEVYERRPGWGGGKRNVTTISLAPLTDEETTELVTDLLSRTVLSADVRSALLERAGGNPLYAEEFVRMLTDHGVVGEAGDGALAADIAVPDSIQSVIAARLDTLSGVQKSLLQDAAVVGKVFWSGALASMGGIDEELVHKELHELARRELVRPSRRSSVEATSEYAFWHVLTRDVAYGEIPRSARGAKHLAAASWIERTAGERAADQAEVLAYHHRLALDLMPNTDAGELERIRRAARDHIVMAGDRALDLDVERALALYEEALAIEVVDTRDRPALLIRMGETATRAGRFALAIDVLEQAVVVARAEGDEAGAARALIALHEPMSFSARPGAAEALGEAIGLLEARPPSEELAKAYAAAALRTYSRDENAECIEWVEKALRVSATLGIDPNPRLYSYRGGARIDGLGDLGGLDDLHHALELATDAGDAYLEARIRNSLGTELYSLEGPAAALEQFEIALGIAERRSMSGILIDVGQSAIDALYDLGRWDELLERARGTATRAEEGQDISSLVYIQTAVADVNACRGAFEEAAALRGSWIRRAEELGQIQVMIPAFGIAAAVALAVGEPREAVEALRRIGSTPAIKGGWNYAAYLPEMVRTALAAGDRQLAGWLADIEPKTPYAEHASVDVRARLLEADGAYGPAAALFADAADRWERFGVVPEQAHALLGLGRSRRAVAMKGWAPPLRAALDIYQRLAARPFIEETNALLVGSDPPTN